MTALLDEGLDFDVRAKRERAALLDRVGGVIAEGLANPAVTEVIVNPDSSVWFDYVSGSMEEQVGRNIPARKVAGIISAIAGLLDRKIINGILECEFPFDGSRVEAWLPPLSTGPALVIRKHRKQGEEGWPALRLSDYGLSPGWRAVIDDIILNRKRLLIVGSTGSGKTTFGGAVLDRVTELCPDDRILTIEDVFEFYCKARNWLPLRATPGVSQRTLLKTAMRARPDRIIIGECRDEVAIDLVMAMRTGHPGFTTTHGESCEDGLTRIYQLTRLSGAHTILPEMILDTFDYVALMRRRAKPLPGESPRYLAEVQKPVEWRESRFVLEPIPHN